MANTQIGDRWLKWNARGIGKPRSSSTGVKHHYVGPIMYAHNWPIGRLVKVPTGTGNVVLLYKGSTGLHTDPKEWAGDSGPRLIKILFVLDIGAFSRFPADVISDAELHERIKQLTYMEVNELIDHVNEWSGDQLFNSPSRYGHSGAGLLMQKMREAVERYDTYRSLFKLDWLPIPAFYDVNFHEALAARRKEYFDPKEVAKRERVVARREAKKAFGIE